MISTCAKAHYFEIKLQIVNYRNHKNFNEAHARSRKNNISLNLQNSFSKVVEKHASLKKKFLDGIRAPYIIKVFSTPR